MARRKLGIEGDIEGLKKHIHFLSALVNLSSQESMAPGASLEEKLLKHFQKERGIQQMYFPVHRNDIMFLYHLYHHQNDIDEAFKSYYNVGFNIAGTCAELIKKHTDDPKVILDFGSGYGRVSRFLPFYFPDAEIAVSEVKPDALLFQKKEFNFSIVSHNEQAESFPKAEYDAIIAGSVFTHLPKELFEKWFASLCNSMTDKGMLMITYNYIERIKNPQSADFHYTSQSEDSFFRVSDRLANAETYGLTFVSQNYLKNLADKNGREIHFEKDAQLAKQKVAILLKP